MGLKISDRFMLAWALIGAVAFLAIWHLPWRFQVNDDAMMMWLVSGAYTGQPESNAVFIHPVLSWIFAKLYTYFPNVRWYQATWFVTMFLSFILFLRCFWKNNFSRTQAGFYSLFLFPLLIHFLFFLQFSIVAAFAITSGLTSQMTYFRRKPKPEVSEKKTASIFEWTLSTVLILLGSLIRLEVLFLVLAGVVVLGVIILKNTSVVKSVLLPLLLLVLLFSLNQIWIMSNDLDDFFSANRLRSSVFDDPMLQLRKDDYERSLPELFYFANGLMDFERDKDLIEKMKVWDQTLDQERLSNLTPSYFFKAFTYLIWNERYFCFLVIILLLFSLVNRFRHSVAALLIFLSIMVGLSPFYLLKIQVYLIIMLVYFMVFFLACQGEKLRKERLVPFLPILAAAVIIHFWSFVKSSANLASESDAKPILHFKSENSEIHNLYLVGLDPLWYYFIDNKPVQIKFLGWPSLRFNQNEGRNVYFISRQVYEQNLRYFDSFIIRKQYPNYLEMELGK